MNSEAVIKGEKDCGFTITYQKWKRLFIWLTNL
jgi:hypothetical protein